MCDIHVVYGTYPKISNIPLLDKILVGMTNSVDADHGAFSGAV